MNLIDIFSIIALLGGGIAIYFWAEIQNKTQKGSQAWLLLSITSVFLITTPLFPILTRNRGVDLEFMTTMLLFWGAVYMCFFAGAGYLLDRTFSLVPRSSIGRYLIEGFEFARPVARESKGISKLLSTSGAVGYTKDDRLEDAVLETALDLIAEGKNVVLMTTMPQSGVYAEYLKVEIEKAHLRLVNISVDGKECKDPGAVNISSENIGDALGIIESLPEDSAFLVSPVGAIYGDDLLALENLVEAASEKGVALYGFIEKGRSVLDDFFLTRVDIEGDVLYPQKSPVDEPILIENYVDYEKFMLRGVY